MVSPTNNLCLTRVDRLYFEVSMENNIYDIRPPKLLGGFFMINAGETPTLCPFGNVQNFLFFEIKLFIKETVLL